MSNSRERLSAQVSSWHPSTNEVTQSSFLSTVVPYGLSLRNVILGGQVTNVTASAGTVTYTCRNNFTAGDRVTITDVVPAAYNLTNVQVATASSTQFTVTNAATGTFVSAGNAFTTFTIPSGITWVYAICVGGGGGTGNQQCGGGGGVAWGWTPATNVCIVGSGAGANQVGGYSRYGSIIAGGGASAGLVAGVGGGGGSSSNNSSDGATNYWGIPGGTRFPYNRLGSGGGGVLVTNIPGATAANGGDGISGGAGGIASGSGSSAQTGGKGGSGLVGGGGGAASNTTGLRTGGNGGSGIGPTGILYTGGTGTIGTGAGFGAGGGGAGMGNPLGANPTTNGNGSNASGDIGGNGGLGGGGGGASSGSSGGFGGNGILYIWY